jgi:RNA polymerase sigma-70 factor, ECF subfamily
VREFLRNDYPRAVAAVALISGSRAIAEDAVQEALARAWERSERGQHIESLRPWVTKVAMNVARSRFRRLLVERRHQSSVAAESAGPSGDLVDLRRALAALPRRQREATVLRYYLDLDVAEVADVLGVSEGTVKTSLYRARQSLAAALSDELEEANESAGA